MSREKINNKILKQNLKTLQNWPKCGAEILEGSLELRKMTEFFARFNPDSPGLFGANQFQKFMESADPVRLNKPFSQGRKILYFYKILRLIRLGAPTGHPSLSANGKSLRKNIFIATPSLLNSLNGKTIITIPIILKLELSAPSSDSSVEPACVNK